MDREVTERDFRQPEFYNADPTDAYAAAAAGLEMGSESQREQTT